MQQNIETERLVLRPFKLSDSKRVSELAGDKQIAEMTENIPHPYNESIAKNWILGSEALFAESKGIVYAITFKQKDEIIGAVSFPKLVDGSGVLGYWVGVPFWGVGIAYEAAAALVEYGKQHYGLNKLEVTHLTENKRSKSVVRKLGVPYVKNKIKHIQGQDRTVCVYASKI
ncbi:GNAT family N-acetyltransferase [Shewanella sp. VB17]|nr:GNAT family N-acetyltransferase [Shewanella sp. VB17]